MDRIGAILTFEDIDKIRLIVKYMGDRDRAGLRNLEGVEYPSDEWFWTTLDTYPVTIIEPPIDYFSSWNIIFAEDTLILEGPMWSIEEGQSELRLFIEKYLDRTPHVIRIKDYRVP
jgi:hypothetical protein